MVKTCVTVIETLPPPPFSLGKTENENSITYRKPNTEGIISAYNIFTWLSHLKIMPKVKNTQQPKKPKVSGPADVLAILLCEE